MDAGQSIRQQDFTDRFQQPPAPQFLIQGKRTLPPDPYNRIILHAFNLGVLSALCAILFPSPNWVRAKDAKLAKG